ncbi:MAG TPA: hypothetical protein DIC52_06435 [Candidatus Latescibacteria bacterium]|nr:hypothetical protein [Candidatus Latescibacterota bacterium]
MPKGFQPILTDFFWSTPRLLVLCLALGTLVRPSDARSSFTARFADAVAGPGVEQTTRLIIDYFPGDGEAIVGLHVRLSSMAGGARFVDVQSGRGQAHVEASSFRLDYGENAVGGQLADTIHVRLLTPARPLSVDLRLATNVDTDTTLAHHASATVAILPPLDVTLQIAPARVYPGESVELRFTASQGEREERSIDSLVMDWPEEMLAVGSPVVTQADTDGAVEALQRVRLRREVTGVLSVPVSVVGAGLQASPLAAAIIDVGAVPTFEVDLPEDDLLRGEETQLHLRWQNQSTAAIQAKSLMATVAAGITGARLASTEPSQTGGARLEADEEKGSVKVLVVGELDLKPGESISVELELTPLTTGPFAFAGSFQPADRMGAVPLGTILVQVAAREERANRTRLASTDLELARAGLEPVLRQALVSLPLARGTTLRIVDSRSDDGNWVVEGLLAQLLLERGVRVLADSTAAHQMHYRLADARVVYAPAGSAWNMFDDSKSRDARMEVFLRLEDADHNVHWVQRVTGRMHEGRAPATADWLGGAKGIDQASVAADHRAIEMGLSGMIVGGLFFVFFAP